MQSVSLPMATRMPSLGLVVWQLRNGPECENPVRGARVRLPPYRHRSGPRQGRERGQGAARERARPSRGGPSVPCWAGHSSANYDGNGPRCEHVVCAQGSSNLGRSRSVTGRDGITMGAGRFGCVESWSIIGEVDGSRTNLTSARAYARSTPNCALAGHARTDDRSAGSC